MSPASRRKKARATERPEKGADAKQKLLDAARDLFAEHGVEGVSLREITRAAGQGNTSALQYHFGDRAGLLQAVVAPHQAQVDARRDALLDELEAEDRTGIRELASALVRPSAAMLEAEGGRSYLQIMAEWVRDPGTAMRKWPGVDAHLERWRAIAKRSALESTSPFHRRYAATQLCFSELARRATTKRRADHQLFVSDLIDLVGAVLSAPVSEQTQRLMDQRDEGKARAQVERSKRQRPGRAVAIAK